MINKLNVSKKDANDDIFSLFPLIDTIKLDNKVPT